MMKAVLFSFALLAAIGACEAVGGEEEWAPSGIWDDEEDECDMSMMASAATERSMKPPPTEEVGDVRAPADSSKRKRPCPPKVSGRWSKLSIEQQAFCRRCRAKADSGGSTSKDLFRNGFKILPDDPSIAAFGEHMTPGAFTVKAVGVWDPMAIWGTKYVPSLPCPYCQNHRYVNPHGVWAGPPRFVYGKRECWFLDTKKYHCGTCDRWFRATNPDSVALLPDVCKASFNVLMGPKFAVDDDVAVLINDLWHCMSAAEISAMLNRWHNENYIAQLTKYWAAASTLEGNGITLRPGGRGSVYESGAFSRTTGADAKSAYERDLKTYKPESSKDKGPTFYPLNRLAGFRRNGKKWNRLYNADPPIKSVSCLASVEENDVNARKYTSNFDLYGAKKTLHTMKVKAQEFLDSKAPPPGKSDDSDSEMSESADEKRTCSVIALTFF